MRQLTHYFCFDRRNVLQSDAVNTLRICREKIFVAIDGYFETFRDQPFAQFLDKSLIAAVDIRVTAGSYDCNFDKRPLFQLVDIENS